MSNVFFNVGRIYGSLSRTNSLVCRQRFETAINAQSRRKVSKSTYPIRNVKVKTRGQSGENFNDGNSYCRYNVGYVDSQLGKGYAPEQKIVVGLHGAMFTHNDMALALEPLANENCRVIIPNFPGNRYTNAVTPQDSDWFTHTPEERGEFIHDFLKALKIPRVDLVVAHSGACYALTNLLAKPDTDFIKAIALISPGTHELSSKFKRYFEISQRLNALWNQPIYRTVLKPFIKLAFRIWGVKPNWEQTIITMKYVAGLTPPAVPGQLEKIKRKNIPRLLFYSLDDNVMGKDVHLFKEYARMLGIPDENFSMYHGDGQLVEESQTDNYPRVVIFKEGSHMPQFRHGHLVAKHLKELLDHVKPK